MHLQRHAAQACSSHRPCGACGGARTPRPFHARQGPFVAAGGGAGLPSAAGSLPVLHPARTLRPARTRQTDGILPRLVQCLGPDAKPSLQLEAVWVLTNIASGTSEHTRAVVDHKAIGPLTMLIHNASPKVREQALWCLGNIIGDR